MKNTLEKLITKSFKRLLDKGIHRGFITYEELGKSLGKRNNSQENVEKAFLHIFDNKVCLVEKKSDYRPVKKKDASGGDSNKGADLDKSDDPIRMYLREMGGVELLSREGEIAIAKRIEAGKKVMITALLQSPLTAQKVFEWKKKLDENEILIREIIDIDSAYVDIESESGVASTKKKKLNDSPAKSKKDSKENETENKNEELAEEDEFNPSLAAMEEEIKPQIILTISNLAKNYAKLIKYQNEKLECALNAQEFSKSKETGYKKIQNELIGKLKSLQLNTSVLEELVGMHHQENKKIISLEGLLLRMAMQNKISREEFLKYYIGNEINQNFESFLNKNIT